MKLFERVLVLTDFSEGSEAAVRRASGIAREHGARVYVLHAVGPRGIVSEPAFAEMEEAASQRLQRIVEGLEAGDVPATAQCHPGSPLEALAAVENELDPDLIVVGARGATRLRRLLLGGVASGVIQHAFAPVLVVRDAENGEVAPFRRVLVASDFSPDPAVAAAAARAISAPDAEFHVAHVDSIPYEAVASLGSAAVERLQTGSRGRLAEESRAFEAESHLLKGNPPHELLRLSRELDCDLIAVGTRGEGTRSWLDPGSVASKVLRRAPGSVLTARRLRWSEPVRIKLEEARAETYRADGLGTERAGLIQTLVDVKRLSDESRELERELLREALGELERIAAGIEGNHPKLSAALGRLAETLAGMGI